MGAVRRTARVPAPLLPGQAGKARPTHFSGSPSKGSRMHGLGGPEGLGVPRAQSASGSTSDGQPVRLRVRPWALLWGAAGARPLELQVRSAGSEAGAPRAPRPTALAKPVSSRRHSPPECLGSLLSRAWWGPWPLEGGEGSGLWRPCRSAGGEAGGSGSRLC